MWLGWRTGTIFFNDQIESIRKILNRAGYFFRHDQLAKDHRIYIAIFGIAIFGSISEFNNLSYSFQYPNPGLDLFRERARLYRCVFETTEIAIKIHCSSTPLLPEMIEWVHAIGQKQTVFSNCHYTVYLLQEWRFNVVCLRDGDSKPVDFNNGLIRFRWIIAWYFLR